MYETLEMDNAVRPAQVASPMMMKRLSSVIRLDVCNTAEAASLRRSISTPKPNAKMKSDASGTSRPSSLEWLAQYTYPIRISRPHGEA